MSGFNGSGTFNISGVGLPYVSGTTISSSVANTLNTDLATGLSTCITKDGQTSIAANIPFNNYKITGLGAGTVANDAANLANIQTSTTQYLTVTGTNTIVGTPSIALTTYAAGNTFRFVAANTNGGAVTLNISSLGAKSVVKNGSTALVSGDLVSGRMYVVVYDGTNFQLVNQTDFNAIAASSAVISGALTVGGASTLTTAAISSGITINTTGNTWASAYKGIEVNALTSYFANAASTYISNNAYNDGSWKYKTTATAALIDQTSGSTTIYSAASGTAGTPITWTTALTASSTGAVTISDLTSTTQSTGNNSTKVATTAFTNNQIASTGLGGTSQSYGAYTVWNTITTYTNTTGKPLLWVITPSISGGNYVNVKINGVLLAFSSLSSGGGIWQSWIIPIGATYEVVGQNVQGYLLG